MTVSTRNPSCSSTSSFVVDLSFEVCSFTTLLENKQKFAFNGSIKRKGKFAMFFNESIDEPFVRMRYFQMFFAWRVFTRSLTKNSHKALSSQMDRGCSGGLVRGFVMRSAQNSKYVRSLFVQRYTQVLPVAMFT